MKEIKDTHLLNTYLNQYKILDIFDTPDLPFRLYSYEPGEIMNYTHPLENYLKFIVCGEISLYSIQEDGEQFIAYQGEFCGLIGDLEFCGLESDNRYQEALTTVYSIELPLSEVRQKLLNDNRFLRYLLYFITKRHSNLTMAEWSRSSTIDQRLLRYLQYEAPNHTLSGVESIAFHLRCSRSQVQRALRKLLSDGQIKKIGKGKYELIQSK